MSATRLLAPGSVDCHSHLYPPAGAFAPRSGQRHEPGADVSNYLGLCDRLGVDRHVLVQAMAYPDPRSLLHGIARIGTARCRGIVFFEDALGADDLSRLHEAGVRGFRFLYRAGEPVDMPAIRRSAETAAALGWHLIVQAEGAELAAHCDTLLGLPCIVVADHTGRLPRGAGPGDPSAQALCRFLGGGGWVKLASPYNLTLDGRSDFAPLSALIRMLVEAGAERLVWGLNFPHPNLPAGGKPDEEGTLRSLLDLLGAAERQKIFVENPRLLYSF